MPSGDRPTDEQSTGRHLLGPHVVGQRVVVRSLVPGETGPTGGPAMTDVLGTCLSWADGVCVVQPESGPRVEIPTRLIVSGKPVPPRPSVRQRVGVAEAERHVLALFPGMLTEPLGEWVLRTEPAPEGRLRKRANSCLALGDPGVPLADAADHVRDWYAARDRDPLVHVEADGEWDAGLAARGWSVVEGGEADFMLGSVSRALRAARRVRTTAEISCHAPSHPLDGPSTGTGSRGDGALQLEARAHLDGHQVGVGVAVVDGDWVGLHGLAVEPAARRTGLATALVAALLDRAAEEGATTAWLHVETSNAPGVALYEGLGFRTHHTVRYRRAPSAPPSAPPRP